MNAKDFCDWMQRMDINAVEFSKKTGISRNTVTRYRREGTPLYIDLACAALSYGLPPMGSNNSAVSSQDGLPNL